MTLKCDLDHDLLSRVKGSAHRLNKRNIWVKFDEILLKGFRRYGRSHEEIQVGYNSDLYRLLGINMLKIVPGKAKSTQKVFSEYF